MPYRAFDDSTGKEWQVWDIVPRLNERRSGEPDRRVRTVVIPFADRRRDERRVATTTARRAVLRGSYAYGWLCFDNGQEKRRLTPIPDDWTTCDDERIEDYLLQATPVAGAHLPTFGGGDDVARAG
jgi:hypothetical protein